jgi:hypothetical protein
MDQLVETLQAAQGAELYVAHLTDGRLLTPEKAVAELA